METKSAHMRLLLGIINFHFLDEDLLHKWYVLIEKIHDELMINAVKTLEQFLNHYFNNNYC